MRVSYEIWDWYMYFVLCFLFEVVSVNFINVIVSFLGYEVQYIFVIGIFCGDFVFEVVGVNLQVGCGVVDFGV